MGHVIILSLHNLNNTDLCIICDITNNKNLYSETDRESIKQWESDIANNQFSFFCSIYYFQVHSWQ